MIMYAELVQTLHISVSCAAATGSSECSSLAVLAMCSFN